MVINVNLRGTVQDELGRVDFRRCRKHQLFTTAVAKTPVWTMMARQLERI